jgi:hypothetical protein
VRKLVSAKSQKILPVKLYREELQELSGIFGRYCESYKISDDDFVYDSLDEMGKSAKAAISKLEIVGINPTVKLTLSRNGSWLQQINDKSEMSPDEIDKRDLVFSRVKDFLNEHKTSTALFLHPGAVVLYGFMMVILSLVGISVWRPKSGYPFLLIPLIVFVTSILQAFGSTVRNNIGHVTVKPRPEATSFFKRKKDELLMLVIGTVLGGIFGAVVTLIVEHFKK